MTDKDHDARSKAQVDAIGIPDDEPHFLPDPVQDRLLEAMITLGGELWVEREYRMRLEAVLVSKGLLSRDEIESYAFSDAARGAQKESLDAMVKRLFEPLKTIPGKR
ncbi:MAG: hypothetical protein AAF004_05125 [Pseudomonadota bacterium]